MKIFLSGGSGFIGRSFIEEALKKNHFIYSISRKNKKNKLSKVKWLKGDLADNWSKYLTKADVVVHLAAEGTSRNTKDLKKIFFTNVYKSYVFIKHAIKSGCRKFIIVSSSSEYGDNKIGNRSFSRNDRRFPNSYYGYSKAIFTDIIKIFAKDSKCKFRVMRLFYTYGDGENSKRFYPKIKKAALNNKNFIVENPSELRDYNKVKNIAKLLLNACNFDKKAKKFHIFHLSNSNSITNKNFAKKIWKKYNATGKLIFKNNKKIFMNHVSNPESNWKIKR